MILMIESHTEYFIYEVYTQIALSIILLTFTGVGLDLGPGLGPGLGLDFGFVVAGSRTSAASSSFA